ncbi:MAG: nitroreductase family protein [Promethearchaeati archaeon SRVP18_Atabeyarchaeia-1]
MSCKTGVVKKLDFFEVIEKRRSTRAYLDKEVEEEKLQKVLEAGNAAPSAGNLQAYEIVVVKSKRQKVAISGAAHGQTFIAQAPVVLVVLANQKRSATKYGKRGSDLYAIQDSTIAASYMQLAATALGLSTCWVGAYDDAAVAEAIGADMSKGFKPEAVLPIGYSKETPRPTPRRKLSELIHKESL